MAIAPEAQEVIAEEERCLEGIIHELENQRGTGSRRFAHEAKRAQDLTSQIVGAKRDVDKQMLASDEAVAHGLTKLKKDEIETIDKLLEKPYFARLVLEEQDGDRTKKIEFRLGHASNVECRIIDWRRAPLAKLFYEYREGDEYNEEIQGRERNGRIMLRHKVNIEAGRLRALSCSLGDFELSEGEGWVERAAKKRTGSGESYGQLPGVLSLITPEQFRTITEESDRAVLLRGVAGSGKTTVGLHRLAFLLAEENSDLKPKDAAIVVLSAGLGQYIRRSLGGLGVDVAVLTYSDWIAPTVAAVLSVTPEELPSLRKNDLTAPGAARVFRSLALLRALEAEHARSGEASPERETLWRVLGRVQDVLELDETKLLDREIVAAARKELEDAKAAGKFLTLEEPLLARLYQLRKKSMRRKGGGDGLYRHLMVDEVQDFYPAELASLIGGVEKAHQLTIVGDTSQASRDQSAFPVWDKLRKFWSLGESLSRFVNLAVSHRSTVPIVRLAQHIQGVQTPVEGRPGKPPLWYHCENEELAVEETLGWLGRVTEKFPNSVTAVVCRSAEEARYLHSLLEPTFGPTVTVAEGGKLDFQDGIIVAPVDMVKGLEFPRVLIWNVSAENYPAKDQGRNLLYIAITRAEENLCLVSYGRASPLLPGIDSKLVRGMRREKEVEEREED